MSYPPNQWNMGLQGQSGQQQNPAMAQGLGMSNPFNPAAVGSPQLHGQSLPQQYAPQARGMQYGSPHIPQQLLGGAGMQVQQSISPRAGSPALPQGLPQGRAVTTGQIASSMLPQPAAPIPQQQQQQVRPQGPVNIGQLLSTTQGRQALAVMLNKTGGSNSHLLANLTPQQKAMVINQLQRPTAAPPTTQHPHPPPLASAPVPGGAQNFNFSPAALANFPTQPSVVPSPPMGGLAPLPRTGIPQQGVGGFGSTGNLTPVGHSPGTFQSPLPTSTSQAASPAAVPSPKPAPVPRKRKAPPAGDRDARSPSGAPSPAAMPSTMQTPPAPSSNRDFVPSVLHAAGTSVAPLPGRRPSTPSVLLPVGASSGGASRPPAPASSYAPPHPGQAPSRTPPHGPSPHNTPFRPPPRQQTVFFAGQSPSTRDRDVDREAAMEKERERVRALRAKENEHASSKRDTMRGQMRNEVARLMYAAGDVVEPDQNTVDYMEDLVVEFISDLCRPIAPIRSTPQNPRQLVPLTPAIIQSRLRAPNPVLRKYAERFDYMTHMSGTLSEARRIDMPSNEDLVKVVGSNYLGLQEGGEERKIGRPRKKARDDGEPKEKKRPGPRKGWKNDNEALERVRQKKEVKKGKQKEKIKARLAVKPEGSQ